MSFATSPLISLVIPAFNVAKYLPALIDSIEPQLTPQIEVVLVDDGSQDSTGAMARIWATDSRHRITVIEQQNGGPARARNAGLAAARGTWVSFPDADDVLAEDYLAKVAAFLRSPRAAAATIVATNLQMLDHASGSVTDSHPLRGKFSRGERVISLAAEPQTVQLHANTTFFRRADLLAQGLQFDARIKPNFEDAAFVTSFLLGVDDPRIAVLPQARYLYRQRGDLTSLVGGSWGNPAKYDDVPRFGYFPLLAKARQRGSMPAWLQYLLLYDLSWYFRKDIQIHSQTSLLSDAQAKSFFGLVRETLAAIEPSVIRQYRISYLPDEIRAVMLALKGALPSPPELRVVREDSEQRLTQLSYYEDASAAPARVAFARDGVPTTPVYAKRRGVTYFGQVPLIEVVSWVPSAASITATIDGITVAPRRPDVKGVLQQYSPHNSGLRRITDAAKLGLKLLRHDRARLFRIIVQLDLTGLSKGHGTSLRTKAVPGRRKYGGCWLLMDRDDQAHDNAEHLYRHLSENRPEINAWFVLNRDSPDWPRLKAEGFRLVAHNSASHALALAHCRELISSQIDHYVVSPPIAFWLRPHPWRFTWLQHGITKDDLSRWVNPKPVSTAIAATLPEYRSFVADGTPYVWTDREVALTGFPRHDALIRLARRVPDDERRTVVFMPTWRRDLLGDGIAVGNRRVTKSGFWESDYVRNWMALVGSEEVRAAAAQAGLELAFMPHPNMGPHLTADRMPARVRLLNYADHDVQDVLARASHVVTDYSSNAFEAALIERPVLYFQFDRDTFFNGEHAYRRGYFDYEADGFGPVCTTLSAAEAELAGLIRSGSTVAEPYASRIAATFPLRDGRASERVVEAVLARRRPFAAVNAAAPNSLT